MLYKSTRGGEGGVSFEAVLFSAYACDGGLYVPEEIPHISHAKLLEWRHHTFPMICAEIVHIFTDIDLNLLNEMTKRAYDTFNNGNTTLPMTKVGDMIFLDASLGPTLAFKDVGQQIVAQLLNYYLQGKSDVAKIMVDTSGDTGPAAIAAVKNCPNLDITVLYPFGRVSAIQELQMITVLEPNVHVYRTDGNTDDQSSVLKEIFNDTEFVKRNNICSINSINWARIMAQSSYFFWAYLQIFNNEFCIGNLVNFSIPSGAFGNAMGGYLARLMGLPIGKIMCATNANDVVHRTISDGNLNMGVNHKTLSPAMDIQYAYNIERMLYFSSNGSYDMVKALMRRVEEVYNSGAGGGESAIPADPILLDKEILQAVQQIFCSCSVSDENTVLTIREIYREYGYALCPHSAVGVFAAQHVFKSLTPPNVPIVCVLTAHPAKFDETYTAATGHVPPMSPACDVSRLKYLETKFEWLHQDNENWRQEWIERLKADVDRK